MATVLSACGGGGGGGVAASSPPAPTSNPPSVLPEQSLSEVDLSAALFTLEDLPQGSRTLIANEDYVASTVPRLILCGEDVRRELNAITGRFAQFEGPEDTYILVNHAVSGLPGDFAARLVDRLLQVGSTCSSTWMGPGLNDRSTEFEVKGAFDVPALLDQRMALEIAHRQPGQADVRLFLVYVRTRQFLSAFTLLLRQDSDTAIVSNLAQIAADKLQRAVQGA